MPGRGKEAQKASEEWAAQAGAKLDKTVSAPTTWTQGALADSEL